jgi:type I restriction-modification system DNA methylase subunit
MTETSQAIQRFVDYAKLLDGDEKGEAQVFCDRLFQAFGHAGYKEAGATLEYRVRKKDKGTSFADLVWKPRLLLEMKKRGEKLARHYTQAFDYWTNAVPHRPRYVILCNFDEFWIYDFDTQLYDPVDRIPIAHLLDRYTAMGFLFPAEKKPQFRNNLVAVTREAAAKVAAVFNSIVKRNEPREKAQRFVLQCVVAMFAEDTELLPRGMFSELLDDCRRGQSSYDLLGSLFRQMNEREPAAGGRFKDVRYFNGGIFKLVSPMELRPGELANLIDAADENWSKVQPPIFGTLFQDSMDKDERHAYGAHFTSEADIQKIVMPTIVRPWRERIASANTLRELKTLLDEICSFKVLDPACGSGNFLYVAFRELKRLELEIMARVHTEFGRQARSAVGAKTLVGTKQFYGIDNNAFAVELAKVTLMLAKELAIDESQHWLEDTNPGLPLEFDSTLPLDNLDDNIRCDDALFCEWPAVQAIIGNPPYQSKNKMQQEYGPTYVERVRQRFPEVPGRADYCVYWFRRAHDEMRPGGRAGLVGTNTIRQNYSREGGLDHIIENGGTITEAVSSQVWSGDAAVHVSIVNWIKGRQKGKKKLYTQLGDEIRSPWVMKELAAIGPSLSELLEVSECYRLQANMDSEACYQGQTHGHEGFLLTFEQANRFRQEPSSRAVLHPYMTGDELLSIGRPARCIIDLTGCEHLIEAMGHKAAFKHVQAAVMPDLENKAREEAENTGKKTGPRQSHFAKWWRLWRGRPELIARLGTISRYVACSRLTKRPIFDFVSPLIYPSDVVQVFTLEDDYSFGILQSSVHWGWFISRCSTLKRDFRYTSDTVFDTFPWPQEPTLSQVGDVAVAAVALRELRRQIMIDNKWSLRELYRTIEVPGKSPLKDAHERLDKAVRASYGMKPKDDPLAWLLKLNHDVAAKEGSMQRITGPGLPPCVKDPKSFISKDCITIDGWGK